MGIPNHPSGAQLIGTLMHEFLELYHAGASLKQLLGEYDPAMKTWENKDASLMRNMMINYDKYSTISKSDPHMTHIPRLGDKGTSFMFEGGDENELQDHTWMKSHGVLLAGRPDLIYQQDGVIYVVEHKTSKDRWDPWRFRVNNQIKLYHMIVSRNFPGHKVECIIQVLRKMPGTRSDVKDVIQRVRISDISVRDTTAMTEQTLDEMIACREYPYGTCDGWDDWCPYTDECGAGDNILRVNQAINRMSCISDMLGGDGKWK